METRLLKKDFYLVTRFLNLKLRFLIIHPLFLLKTRWHSSGTVLRSLRKEQTKMIKRDNKKIKQGKADTDNK